MEKELSLVKEQLEESKHKIDHNRQLRDSKVTELSAALRDQAKLNERLVKLSGHNDQLRTNWQVGNQEW